MLPFNKRTAADMVDSYEAGIIDIDERIGKIESETKRHKESSAVKSALIERRRVLWDMRGDMARAIHMMKPYVKGGEGTTCD